MTDSGLRERIKDPTEQSIPKELPADNKECTVPSGAAPYQPPGQTWHLFGFHVNSVWIVTHVVVLIYAMCFFIQSNVMPYLTKKLGVDPVTYGYLETMFAVMQLIGGPLFGRFGDVFGGRAAFFLAFIASAISFSLIGLSNSIPMLFISKIPSIFMHANQAGSMVITDISKPEDRSSSLGTLGVMFGIGMVLGPLISGQITSRYGPQSSPFCAASLCLFCVVLCLIYVPKQTKKKDAVKQQKDKSIFSLSKWRDILRLPGILPLLSVKTLLGLPMGAFHAMFSVMVVEKFKLEPHQNGYMMSYVGILIMIMQGMVIGGLARRVGEMKLVKIANMVLIFAWIGLGNIQTVYQWAFVSVPHIFGMVVQMVVITSILTKIVPAADTGAMMGLNMAGNSVVRMFAPMMGGYMMQQWGFVSLGYLGAAISVFLTVLLLVVPVKVPKS